MKGSLRDRMIPGASLDRAGDSAPRAESGGPDRLAAAAALRNDAAACQACWRQGRDAAVKAAKTGGIEAARVVTPAAREYQHHLVTWTAGRDAVVEVLTRT